MDSRTRPPSPHDMRLGMAAYQQHLRQLDPMQLTAELTRINAALQMQAQSASASVLSDLTQRNLDSPVLRSIPMDDPLSGRASPPSPSRSPQPGPVDLLLQSRRAGPRLVAKLVASDVRRRASNTRR